MVDRALRGGIGARVDVEIEIKRSRFLCRIVRVESEEAARRVIDEARKEHWNARHHCSAFVIGSASAPSQLRRSNDDGEPSGTAGRPILEALTGRGLVDCVAVVTRYFGGTLLGAGGLVRAYSDATLSAIDRADAEGQLVVRQRRSLFSLELPHADAGRVEAELRQRGVVVVGVDYGRSVVLRVAGENASLAALVAGITSGAGTLEAIGEQWVDVEG